MSSVRLERVPHVALVAALTLIGALLRLWNLGGQSLWLDEVFTARIAPLDLAAIIAAISTDLDTPPLHPFIVHVFLALGNNDFVLRLPSALAAVLSVPLMYTLGRRLLGQTTGLLAALFLALSPFAIYYAQEARMYSLVLLFALLAFYCLLRAFDAQRSALNTRHSSLWWPGFVLASVLGVYTHFFGFLVLGLLIIYAGLHFIGEWRAGQRQTVARGVRYLLLSLLAITIFYLPWLPVLLDFLAENYAPVPYGQGWQANLSPRIALNTLTLMLGGYWAPVSVRWTTRTLFVVGLLAVLHRRPALGLFVVLSTTLPFVLIAVLNPGHFVTERYFIFMLPVLVLTMAEGCRALAELAATVLGKVSEQVHGHVMTGQGGKAGACTKVTLAVVVIAVAVLSAPGIRSYYTEPPKPAWRTLARYIAGAVPTGDLVVVAMFPHWDKEPLQHYLNMGGRRVVYAAEEPALRSILAAERSHPWWVVYAGSERRLGKLISRGVGNHFTVVPFDFLAIVRRNGETVDALDDGRSILRVVMPRIPGPYQGEVRRVINGLSLASGDMGKPIPPPLPTIVK